MTDAAPPVGLSCRWVGWDVRLRRYAEVVHTANRAGRRVCQCKQMAWKGGKWVRNGG